MRATYLACLLSLGAATTALFRQLDGPQVLPDAVSSQIRGSQITPPSETIQWSKCSAIEACDGIDCGSLGISECDGTYATDPNTNVSNNLSCFGDNSIDFDFNCEMYPPMLQCATVVGQCYSVLVGSEIECLSGEVSGVLPHPEVPTACDDYPWWW